MESRRERGTARIMLDGYVKLVDSTGREDRRASGSILTVNHSPTDALRADD